MSINKSAGIIIGRYATAAKTDMKEWPGAGKCGIEVIDGSTPSTHMTILTSMRNSARISVI